jgi:methylmalonyl-CoA carboxyltransferase large subunit
MSDNDLKAQLAELTKRVAQLEKQIEALSSEIPEDHLVAIAAAVAGYLGHKAKIRHVSFSSSGRWLSNTRRSQHDHQANYMR